MEKLQVKRKEAVWKEVLGASNEIHKEEKVYLSEQEESK